MAERQMRMMKSARKSGKEVRAILDLLLEIYDVEPIEELIKIAQATKDPGLATKIWLAFNEYRLPKLKAVEHGGNVNVQHNVTIVRFGEDGQARGEDLTNRQRAIDVEVASG